MEKEKIRELVQEIQYSNNRSSEKRIDENQKDQIINEIVQENFPELKEFPESRVLTQYMNENRSTPRYIWWIFAANTGTRKIIQAS